MVQMNFDVKIVSVLSLCIVCFCLIVLNSVVWILILPVCYLGSTIWSLQLINSLGLNSQGSGTVKPKEKLQNCDICNDAKCTRHKATYHSNKLKIPTDLNNAIEKLLENILQTYVCTWYSDFSMNDAFIQQLRLAVTVALRNMTGRVLEADISGIIFRDLIPIGVQHAKHWRALVNKAKLEGGRPEDYVIEYLGINIHPAAYSRKAELNYLRGLATTLIPHVLPDIRVSVNNKIILREILSNWVLLPAMDALADPSNINLLVSLSTHHDGELSQSTDAPEVTLLQTWIAPNKGQSNEDPLRPSLEEILNDPQLLYLFMQHIKEIGPMNLLQFCLDIDDLSKRMLNPEISVEAEKTLYNDAMNIYTTYLDPNGPECIRIPLSITQGIEEILQGGVEKIQELRTSRPLYQAHQEAYALLEATCLSSFYHSYQLYQLLCGSQLEDLNVKELNQTQNSNSAAGSKIGSQLGKIRGVLKVSTVEGSFFQTHPVYQAEEVNCSPKTYQEILFEEDRCKRDLSTWRLTIPQVEFQGTQPPIYMIAVHSASEDKSWRVLRRDQDFYALRARLLEFHGDRELSDALLPTRKQQQYTSSLISMQKQCYQEFIQKLLTKPSLKSSELLHNFLTVAHFKPYLSNYSPDIGVLYQSMAHKLRKEKGQHLDKFIGVFLASTSTNHETPDLGVEPSHDQMMAHCDLNSVKGYDLFDNSPFGDNLNLENSSPYKRCDYKPPPELQVRGATLCIADIFTSLLNFSDNFSSLTWLFASLLHKDWDSWINKFLFETLVKLLSGGRAAIVVKLLHAKLFNDECLEENAIGSSLTESQEQQLYETAREGLHSILPWWCFGLRGTWIKTMDSLIEPLQSPALNKHLAYLLLDQLVLDIFPEVSSVISNQRL